MRIALLLLTLSSVAALGGCRVCDSCYDCAYPAYGGSWQRTNRDSGRVGSIFEPAGAKVASTLQAPPKNSPTWESGSSEESDADDAEDKKLESELDELMKGLEDDVPDPKSDESADGTAPPDPSVLEGT